MFPKYRCALIVIIFILGACDSTTTSSPPAEPTLTETFPETELPTDYFEGFPPEYQEMMLPEGVIEILKQGGYVVPLPQDPTTLQQELEAAAQSFNYDLSIYDLNRIVRFPSAQEGDFTYLSVPTKPEFIQGDLDLVGLIYDLKGAYLDDGKPKIYEVRFYDDRAVLRDPQEMEISLYKDKAEYFAEQMEPPVEIPLVVFVKNGCWLCGWASRCGCLICR